MGGGDAGTAAVSLGLLPSQRPRGFELIREPPSDSLIGRGRQKHVSLFDH